MRFAELGINEEIDDSLSLSVKEVLDHLVHQANDTTDAGDAKVDWNTFEQMMPLDVTPLDYKGFKQMYDMDPDWKHLIRSFDEEGITLNTDEDSEMEVFDQNIDTRDPDEVVGQMANRALDKRM